MQAKAERLLTLPALIDDLRREQLLNPDAYALAQSLRRKADEQGLHAITLLGRQGYADARQIGRLLNEQVLVEWLAHKHKLDFVQIDPLEVDVPAVTEVMSYAFAERHGILAVKVSTDTVVIACAEPQVDSWVTDVEHVTRRQVKRVLAAPGAIER